MSVVVQTGGKVTCTSWELNPWCEVQPRVATPWCEVQTLGSTPWCEVQPLVSELDDAARTRTRCCPVGGGVHATTGLKPTRVATALSPQQGVLSSVACAWFGLLPKGCRSRVRSQRGTNRVETTLTSHVRHRAPQVASRIALCTRPPTTHSRGALGHTSWI
jgi:hypothetical protein